MEKTANNSEFNKREVERMIPNMSRDLIRLKKQTDGYSFPKTEINGFPAEFHTMMISSVIASDALASYTVKDGNVYSYISWYLESAVNMIIKELEKHTIKSDFILSSPLNFYKKIANTFYRDKDIKKISEVLSIPENRQCIEKAVEIYEERIL